MLVREAPTSSTKLRERTCQLKAEIGYLDPAKARATVPLAEKLEKMNAAIDKHPQNEVDPFSYLVYGCLHVPPTGPILAYSDSSPQGACSLDLLLEAQESVEVRWL